MQAAAEEPRKWRELAVFFILAVLIWPVIAMGFVGAYGFSFWMYFIFAGPPGPHG